MAARNFERDPIVVEVKVRLFIYKDIPNLKKRLDGIVNDSQEQLFDLLAIGGYSGLDEVSYEIVEK